METYKINQNTIDFRKLKKTGIIAFLISTLLLSRTIFIEFGRYTSMIHAYIEILLLPITITLMTFIHELLHCCLFYIFSSESPKVRLIKNKENKYYIICPTNIKAEYSKSKVITILIFPMICLDIILFFLLKFSRFKFTSSLLLILNTYGSSLDIYLSSIMYNHKGSIVSFDSEKLQISIKYE